MKKIILLSILLFPVYLFAQKHTDANLLGHVINSKTGEHVAYVSVFLQGTTIGAATDESGHFHIANCPEGTFTVGTGVGVAVTFGVGVITVFALMALSEKIAFRVTASAVPLEVIPFFFWKERTAPIVSVS